MKADKRTEVPGVRRRWTLEAEELLVRLMESETTRGDIPAQLEPLVGFAPSKATVYAKYRELRVTGRAGAKPLDLRPRLAEAGVPGVIAVIVKLASGHNVEVRGTPTDVSEIVRRLG